MSGLVHKELRPLYKAAVKDPEWRVESARSGAGFKLYPPDGSPPIGIHATPKAHGKYIPNVKARCRKLGLRF